MHLYAQIAIPPYGTALSRDRPVTRWRQVHPRIRVDRGQFRLHAEVPLKLEGFECAAVAATESNWIPARCIDIQVGVLCRPKRVAKGFQFRIGAVLRGREES